MLPDDYLSRCLVGEFVCGLNGMVDASRVSECWRMMSFVAGLHGL